MAMGRVLGAQRRRALEEHLEESERYGMEFPWRHDVLIR